MFRSIVTTAAILGLAMAAGPASSQQVKGVLGVLDPQTGAFRPMPTAPSSASAEATAAATSGMVRVNFVAYNVSKIPATQTLSCGVTVELYDSSVNYYQYTQYVTPAVVTATAVTCGMNLPYSGTVNASATTLSATFQITATATPTTKNAFVSQSLASKATPLPANGAVTTFNFSGGHI